MRIELLHIPTATYIKFRSHGSVVSFEPYLKYFHWLSDPEKYIIKSICECRYPYSFYEFNSLEYRSFLESEFEIVEVSNDRI